MSGEFITYDDLGAFLTCAGLVGFVLGFLFRAKMIREAPEGEK